MGSDLLSFTLPPLLLRLLRPIAAALVAMVLAIGTATGAAAEPDPGQWIRPCPN
jgi:hypothetical protein